MLRSTHKGMASAARVLALTCAVAVALSAVAQGPRPSTVYVDDVRMEKVQQQRMITGNMRSPQQSNLATQEAGLVLEMLVQEGCEVAAGELIARLDSRRLVLQIAQAEADLLVLKATLLEQVAELGQEDRDLELMRGAFERNAANPKELREAESAQAIAAARKSAAERRVEATQALISLWKERLADTQIRAPYAGTVIAKHVDAGEWLAEGDPVVEIVALDSLEAWLEVPQEYLPAARQARRTISLRSEATGRMYESRDYRVVPQVDSKARTFMVVVTLANDDGELVPGLSVVAWVPADDEREHLTIPKNAVLRNEVGSFVYVARESGEGHSKQVNAVPLQVQPLFPIADRWAARAEGLHAGDRVVVEGNERLFPMAAITPLPAPAKPSPSFGGAIGASPSHATGAADR